MKYRKMLVGLFATGAMVLPAVAANAATTTNAGDTKVAPNGGFKGMG